MDECIKISKGFYINKSRYLRICAYEGQYIKKLIRKYKKENPDKIKDYTFGGKILSVIEMDDKTYALLPVSADTVNKHINKEE